MLHFLITIVRQHLNHEISSQIYSFRSQNRIQQRDLNTRFKCTEDNDEVNHR